ncbi:MAG: hypothetical protein WA957_03665 [Alteraurantiacibacter sp.]
MSDAKCTALKVLLPDLAPMALSKNCGEKALTGATSLGSAQGTDPGNRRSYFH